jgi:hypothetical protein
MTVLVTDSRCGRRPRSYTYVECTSHPEYQEQSRNNKTELKPSVLSVMSRTGLRRRQAATLMIDSICVGSKKSLLLKVHSHDIRTYTQKLALRY